MAKATSGGSNHRSASGGKPRLTLQPSRYVGTQGISSHQYEQPNVIDVDTTTPGPQYSGPTPGTNSYPKPDGRNPV